MDTNSVKSRFRYSYGTHSFLEALEQLSRLKIVFPQQPLCSKVRHTIAVIKIHTLLILKIAWTWVHLLVWLFYQFNHWMTEPVFLVAF